MIGCLRRLRDNARERRDADASVDSLVDLDKQTLMEALQATPRKRLELLLTALDKRIWKQEAVDCGVFAAMAGGHFDHAFLAAAHHVNTVDQSRDEKEDHLVGLQRMVQQQLQNLDTSVAS